MYSITNYKNQVLYCQCVLLFVAHCLRQEVHGAPRVETGLFVCVNGASIQCTHVHLLHQVGAPARASTTVYFGVWCLDAWPPYKTVCHSTCSCGHCRVHCDAYYHVSQSMLFVIRHERM